MTAWCPIPLGTFFPNGFLISAGGLLGPFVALLLLSLTRSISCLGHIQKFTCGIGRTTITVLDFGYNHTELNVKQVLTAYGTGKKSTVFYCFLMSTSAKNYTE
jgi:hypothetical protein